MIHNSPLTRIKIMAKQIEDKLLNFIMQSLYKKYKKRKGRILVGNWLAHLFIFYD